MERLCNWVVAFAVANVLTACGGSSGASNVDRTRPVAKYSEYDDQFRALHATWDSISFTDASNLPMSGSASYSGVVKLDVERGADEISLAGQLNLQVSFARDQIDGNARHFADETNAAYDGALTLTNGTLDRGADPAVDYTFKTDITGKLSSSNDSFDVTADLSGDFRGDSWGATSGVIQGSADSSFGTGYVFGEFIAQR